MIWSPDDDDGCRFGHHRRRRATDYIKTRGVDRKILISTIINGLLRYNFLSATSPDTMDGLPARSIALIHQLHVAGEEGGSATMVAVFLPVLPVGVVLWLSSRDVTRSSYVAFGTKKTKGGAGAGNILSHIGVHHTSNKCC